MSKYPGLSPYVAFNNNPLYFTDPFGDDPPERFGFFKRVWNVIKGDKHLNRANELANKSGQDVYSTFDGEVQIVANREAQTSTVFVSKRFRKDWLLKQMGVNDIGDFDVKFLSEEEMMWNILSNDLFSDGLITLFGHTFYDDVEGTAEGDNFYAQISIQYTAVVEMGLRFPHLGVE